MPLPNAATPLILVCLEDHPKTVMMLRIARKRAQEHNGQWRAVFVETPAQLLLEESKHERMLRLLALAGDMGGETLHIQSETVEKGLALILEKEEPRLALLMIGSSESESKWWSINPLPWVRLARLGKQYTQVEIVPLSGQPYRRSMAERLHWHRQYPLYSAYALLAVGAASLVAWVFQRTMSPELFSIDNQNVGLLYMIACAFIAGRFGLLPGIVASVASFFMLNYYYTPPFHSLKLLAVNDAINMGLFMFAVLLIALFASQSRIYAQRAARRELSTEALFTLYRIASDAFTREQVLEKLHTHLEAMLYMDVAFFLPPVLTPDGIALAYPRELELEDGDHKALEMCWSEMRTAGRASSYNPGTSWRFEPMISQISEIGVLAVRPRGETIIDAWSGRLLSAIADQTATILEHIGIERSLEEGRVRDEREKLRAMLLSSISHDFKTPLAGIIGALSVHRSLGEKLAPQKRNELIDAAMEEAQRLDSFITNILDITRLESGNVRFRKDWHSIESLIAVVAKRLQYRLRHHELVVHSCPKPIEVYMDAMMTEQVLQNLLDNACKYAPPHTKIEITCGGDKTSGLLCEIRDHGTGLPEDRLGSAFDKYARLHKKDSQVAGTGLGLAISKAIMEGQGGSIAAANHPEGGAVFTLTFPQWRDLAAQDNSKYTDGDKHAFHEPAHHSH